MFIVFDVYIVGMCLAFIMGCMLATYYNGKEEEQQIGLLAILALMSWIAVLLMAYKYRSIYKRQIKWFFRKCNRLWCKTLIWMRDCQCL